MSAASVGSKAFEEWFKNAKKQVRKNKTNYTKQYSSFANRVKHSDLKAYRSSTTGQVYLVPTVDAQMLEKMIDLVPAYSYAYTDEELRNAKKHAQLTYEQKRKQQVPYLRAKLLEMPKEYIGVYEKVPAEVQAINDINTQIKAANDKNREERYEIYKYNVKVKGLAYGEVAAMREKRKLDRINRRKQWEEANANSKAAYEQWTADMRAKGYMPEAANTVGEKVDYSENSATYKLFKERQDIRNVADFIDYSLSKGQQKNIRSATISDGHIMAINYNQLYQLMEVKFRNRGDVCVFFEVPSSVAAVLIHLMESNIMAYSTIGFHGQYKMRHAVGVEFWNLVRIRGTQHGIRYRFTYTSGGPTGDAGKSGRQPGTFQYTDPESIEANKSAIGPDGTLNVTPEYTTTDKKAKDQTLANKIADKAENVQWEQDYSNEGLNDLKDMTREQQADKAFRNKQYQQMSTDELYSTVDQVLGNLDPSKMSTEESRLYRDTYDAFDAFGDIGPNTSSADAEKIKQTLIDKLELLHSKGYVDLDDYV